MPVSRCQSAQYPLTAASDRGQPESAPHNRSCKNKSDRNNSGTRLRLSFLPVPSPHRTWQWGVPRLRPYNRQWSAWQTHSRSETGRKPPRPGGFQAPSGRRLPGLPLRPVPGRCSGNHGHPPHIPGPGTALRPAPSSPEASHFSSTPALDTVSEVPD